MPVAMPKTTPQSRISCQSCCTNTTPVSPSAMVVRLLRMTRRGPKRSINQPPSGANNPRSKRLRLAAEAICVRLQPNSASNGWISTEGAERIPAAVRLARKLKPTTNQP